MTILTKNRRFQPLAKKNTHLLDFTYIKKNNCYLVRLRQIDLSVSVARARPPRKPKKGYRRAKRAENFWGYRLPYRIARTGRGNFEISISPTWENIFGESISEENISRILCVSPNGIVNTICTQIICIVTNHHYPSGCQMGIVSQKPISGGLYLYPLPPPCPERGVTLTDKSVWCNLSQNPLVTSQSGTRYKTFLMF